MITLEPLSRVAILIARPAPTDLQPSDSGYGQVGADSTLFLEHRTLNSTPTIILAVAGCQARGCANSWTTYDHGRRGV